MTPCCGRQLFVLVLAAMREQLDAIQVQRVQVRSLPGFILFVWRLHVLPLQSKSSC